MEDNMEEQHRDTVGKYGHQERCLWIGIILMVWGREITRNTQKSVSHSDQNENARTTIYIIQEKGMRAPDLASLRQWRGASCVRGSWAGKTESLSAEQALHSNSQKKHWWVINTVLVTKPKHSSLCASRKEINSIPGRPSRVHCYRQSL